MLLLSSSDQDMINKNHLKTLKKFAGFMGSSHDIEERIERLQLDIEFKITARKIEGAA